MFGVHADLRSWPALGFGVRAGLGSEYALGFGSGFDTGVWVLGCSWALGSVLIWDRGSPCALEFGAAFGVGFGATLMRVGVSPHYRSGISTADSQP